MDLYQLVRDLVALDTTTGHEQPATDYLAAALARAGWQVTRQPVAPGRENLYAVREPPVVVFSTHLDTVPPYRPLRETAETFHGRGTCDAKGIAAAMVTAAEQLASAGERRVGLLFLVGEENGSDGAKAAATLGPRGRYLVNGEPTENRLTIGQKGVLRVDLHAEGRAAHSAYPEEGRSAVLPLLDAIRDILALDLPADPLLGPTTCNVGTIEGGVAPNVIPPSARAQLLFRTTPATAPTLRDRVRAAAGPAVTVSFPLEIPPVQAAALPGWRTTTVSFCSDLAFLPAWGTGYQLGPGSIRVAHTDEEHVHKKDLDESVALYVQLARDLIAREAA